MQAAQVQPTIQELQTQHQIELEKLYSKNQTIPRIRAEFEQYPEFAERMEKAGIPVRFGMDLLVQMALHKKAELKTLIGLLYHHLNNAQATADMLLKCAQADLVDFDTRLANDSGRPGMFVVLYEISQDVQDDLDRFQYPLPMVVEPLPIETNKDTGYFLNKGSVILRNNHHEDDVSLDHLNRMNRIRFTINEDVASMVHNSWRNLDKPKEGESKTDFDRRKKAFEKYDRTARDVMDYLMQHERAFYLTHKFDKRGRVYCQGYHVSYMATAWNKAVIQFADMEFVE